MEAPEGAPPWLAVFTADERPHLWERVQSEGTFEPLWAEYNRHGIHADEYFGALVPRFAHLQALFVDDRSGSLVARARTVPFCWDGSLERLPGGIDALGMQAVRESRAPTALSALSAEVRADYQRSGLSGIVITAMAAMARRAGLAPLVAPVRPMWKDRFPLHAIDDYARWERRDGLPFDPWIRLHVRLGAQVLRTEPTSMEFSAPVSDWEAWTGHRFNRDGIHVFPGGLAPLQVAGHYGRYWEPNVWMRHEVVSEDRP
jgi:GNAT superfamily N-acetyltransferase